MNAKTDVKHTPKLTLGRDDTFHGKKYTPLQVPLELNGKPSPLMHDVLWVVGASKEEQGTIVRAINSHEKLQNFILRYGKHDANCNLKEDRSPGGPWVECSCGFEEAIKAADGEL